MYILFQRCTFKEGIQAAGANATDKHIEYLSLCGMFLLEAGRKANKAFNLPPTSKKHTVAEEKLTMTKALLDRLVVQESGHSGYFSDPTTKGMEDKVARGWIEEVLGRLVKMYRL